MIFQVFFYQKQHFTWTGVLGPGGTGPSKLTTELTNFYPKISIIFVRLKNLSYLGFFLQKPRKEELTLTYFVNYLFRTVINHN